MRYKACMGGATVPATLVLFLTMGAGSFAQSGTLTIAVLEGEGALNDIRSRRAKDPLVRIENSAGAPVFGAAVNFILPARGAGGSFNGEMSLTVVTGTDGIAAGRGLRPNKIAGRFQIRVTASLRGETASATISQTNVAPVAGGPDGKKIGILALIGGAAIGAVVAATRGGGTSQSGTATGISAGSEGTTASPGTPSFGPPR